MKFKVINPNGRTVMSTEYICCIPDEYELKSMSKAGYKFQIDGKNATLKKIKELVQKYDNKEN